MPWKPRTNRGTSSTSTRKSDWLEGWMDKLEIALLGGLREDSSDFSKRLTAAPRPAYPDLARRAGIEGIVKLQVKVKTDGSIEVQKDFGGRTGSGGRGDECREKMARKPHVHQWNTHRDDHDDHI